MSLVGFKAKNHVQQVRAHGPDHNKDDRRTIPEVFDPIHREFGFTLDAAASADNCKVPKFFDLAADGLVQSWRGERVWLNPPYSNLGPWVRKALDETAIGGCPVVVMLLPANRCEQKFWQDMIEPTRDRPWSRIETRFLPGRPRFGWGPSRVRPEKGDRPPFGLVLVIIRQAVRDSKPRTKETIPGMGF